VKELGQMAGMAAIMATGRSHCRSEVAAWTLIAAAAAIRNHNGAAIPTFLS
jgi:hypothetical protein